MKSFFSSSDENLKWTTLSVKELLKTFIYTVTEKTQQAFNGQTGKFYVINSNDWVIVIPRQNGKLLMVKQWRHGENSLSIEFPGGVIDNGRSLRRAGSDHGVLRCADARQRERYLRAAKVRGPAHDTVVALLDLRAEKTQSMQMQIDRPRAKLAAAGERHLRLAETGEQRAKKDHGGAHPVHQLTRNVTPRGRGRINAESVAAARRDAAEITEYVHCRINVAQIRAVEQLRFRAAEERRRDHRQNRVF